jgi:hypothetical protein
MMVRTHFARSLMVVAACCTFSACPGAPTGSQLAVSGLLTAVGDNVSYSINHDDAAAFGEWWPCDAMLTSQGCTNNKFVRVLLARPEFGSIDDVGGGRCISDGVADGVYERLLRAYEEGGRLEIPSELNVFMVVAADGDDDLGADLTNPVETAALSKMESGTLVLERLTGGYDGDISLRIEGASEVGSVDITFRGVMTNPPTPSRTVPRSDTCVSQAQ